MLAPPKKGALQRKDGRSAKELAKAWCERKNYPSPPEEFLHLLAPLVNADQLAGAVGWPEHQVPIDQVVIVPIPRGNWQETVLPRARELRDRLVLAGVRVMLDDRDAYTPGWKFAEWELRGVPVRLEIGPKDIEKSQVVLARRDTREKIFVPIPRGNWRETVLPHAQAIRAALAARGVRMMLDDRDAYTPGWKFSEWELRGVPLRLEIGQPFLHLRTRQRGDQQRQGQEPQRQQPAPPMRPRLPAPVNRST